MISTTSSSNVSRTKEKLRRRVAEKRHDKRHQSEIETQLVCEVNWNENIISNNDAAAEVASTTSSRHTSESVSKIIMRSVAQRVRSVSPFRKRMSASQLIEETRAKEIAFMKLKLDGMNNSSRDWDCSDKTYSTNNDRDGGYRDEVPEPQQEKNEIPRYLGNEQQNDPNAVDVLPQRSQQTQQSPINNDDDEEKCCRSLRSAKAEKASRSRSRSQARTIESSTSGSYFQNLRMRSLSPFRPRKKATDYIDDIRRFEATYFSTAAAIGVDVGSVGMDDGNSNYKKTSSPKTRKYDVDTADTFDPQTTTTRAFEPTTSTADTSLTHSCTPSRHECSSFEYNGGDDDSCDIKKISSSKGISEQNKNNISNSSSTTEPTNNRHTKEENNRKGEMSTVNNNIKNSNTRSSNNYDNNSNNSNSNKSNSKMLHDSGVEENAAIELVLEVRRAPAPPTSSSKTTSYRRSKNSTRGITTTLRNTLKEFSPRNNTSMLENIPPMSFPSRGRSKTRLPSGTMETVTSDTTQNKSTDNGGIVNSNKMQVQTTSNEERLGSNEQYQRYRCDDMPTEVTLTSSTSSSNNATPVENTTTTTPTPKPKPTKEIMTIRGLGASNNSGKHKQRPRNRSFSALQLQQEKIETINKQIPLQQEQLQQEAINTRSQARNFSHDKLEAENPTSNKHLSSLNERTGINNGSAELHSLHSDSTKKFSNTFSQLSLLKKTKMIANTFDDPQYRQEQPQQVVQSRIPGGVLLSAKSTDENKTAGKQYIETSPSYSTMDNVQKRKSFRDRFMKSSSNSVANQSSNSMNHSKNIEINNNNNNIALSDPRDNNQHRQRCESKQLRKQQQQLSNPEPLSVLSAVLPTQDSTTVNQTTSAQNSTTIHDFVYQSNNDRDSLPAYKLSTNPGEEMLSTQIESAIEDMKQVEQEHSPKAQHGGSSKHEPLLTSTTELQKARTRSLGDQSVIQIQRALKRVEHKLMHGSNDENDQTSSSRKVALEALKALADSLESNDPDRINETLVNQLIHIQTNYSDQQHPNVPPPTGSYRVIPQGRQYDVTVSEDSCGIEQELRDVPAHNSRQTTPDCSNVAPKMKTRPYQENEKQYSLIDASTRAGAGDGDITTDDEGATSIDGSSSCDSHSFSQWIDGVDDEGSYISGANRGTEKGGGGTLESLLFSWLDPSNACGVHDDLGTTLELYDEADISLGSDDASDDTFWQSFRQRQAKKSKYGKKYSSSRRKQPRNDAAKDVRMESKMDRQTRPPSFLKYSKSNDGREKTRQRVDDLLTSEDYVESADSYTNRMTTKKQNKASDGKSKQASRVVESIERPDGVTTSQSSILASTNNPMIDDRIVGLQEQVANLQSKLNDMETKRQQSWWKRRLPSSIRASDKSSVAASSVFQYSDEQRPVLSVLTPLIPNSLYSEDMSSIESIQFGKE